MDAPINLLIVDDEIPVVKALERQLRGKYTVYKAYSAEEGLELIRRHKPDIILTDLPLPDLPMVYRWRRRSERFMRTMVSSPRYSVRPRIMPSVGMLSGGGALRAPSQLMCGVSVKGVGMCQSEDISSVFTTI